MWPFRRAGRLAEDLVRETAEKLRIAVQVKQAAEDCKARLAAEAQARLERLGRRQTEIRFRDGTLVTLRGIGLNVSDAYGHVAARVEQVWDPNSNISRITIPIDEVMCMVSTHRGDDAVPETSITFSKWKD